MNITKFGSITVDSLIKKGGIRLAAYLKADIFDSTSLPSAMKLYDRIYQQVDGLLFGLNNGEADDKTAVNRLLMARDEIENFFGVMSRKDVCEKIWELDYERGNTALFRDLDKAKVREIFPYIIRFFDLFHGNDFKDARIRVNEMANEPNPAKFIDTSLAKMQVTQDKHSYAHFRTHFSAKYRGLFRAAAYTARKTRNSSRRKK